MSGGGLSDMAASDATAQAARTRSARQAAGANERGGATEAAIEQSATGRCRPAATGSIPSWSSATSASACEDAMIELIAQQGLPGRAHRRSGQARARLPADLLQPLRRQGRAVPERLRRDRRPHRADGHEGLRRASRRQDERLRAGDARLRRARGGRARGDVAARARRLRRRRPKALERRRQHARRARAQRSAPAATAPAERQSRPT